MKIKVDVYNEKKEYLYPGFMVGSTAPDDFNNDYVLVVNSYGELKAVIISDIKVDMEAFLNEN